MKRSTILSLYAVMLTMRLASLDAQPADFVAQPLQAAERSLVSWLSTTGSFSIVPIDQLAGRTVAVTRAISMP